MRGGRHKEGDQEKKEITQTLQRSKTQSIASVSVEHVIFPL